MKVREAYMSFTSISAKDAIKGYLDAISVCRFKAKFPTLLILAVLLSLTFVQGLDETTKYITGASALFVMLMTGVVKV